jgi:hypothetical protein
MRRIALHFSRASSSRWELPRATPIAASPTQGEQGEGGVAPPPKPGSGPPNRRNRRARRRRAVSKNWTLTAPALVPRRCVFVSTQSPIPLGHLCGSDARRTLRPRRHELVSRAEECPKTLWTFRTCLRGEPQAGNWPPEELTRRVNRSVCKGARLMSAGRTSACVNEADVRPRQVAPNGTPPRPPSRYLHAVRSCAEFIHDLRENSATQHLPLACRQTTCAECLLEGRFPFQAPGPKVGNLSGLRGAPLRMRNVRRVACMDLLVLLAMRVRNGLRDGLRMKRADEECTEDRRGGT